jgi:hypothetical protein
MKPKGFLPACLVLILAASLPAAIPNPLPPMQFQTTPPDPTPSTGLRFTLAGTWPDSCPPNDAKIGLIDALTIGIDLLLPNVGATDCNALTCTHASSAWQINVPAGPFLSGTYSVYVRAVGCNTMGAYQLLSQLQIGLGTGGPAPTGFMPGQRVVLLQDNPPGGTGLVAGRTGVVVCCDAADCSGQVLVSWDFFTNGKGDPNLCMGDHPPVFAPNSATWLDPRVTLLGQAFDQCGTLAQGKQGCILLQTDAGPVYDLIDGSWLSLSVGAKGPFHFGDHVRVQGLLTTTRRLGVFYICPRQDGDIYSPVLSFCTPVSGGCCSANYHPGDRVVLLVDQPMGIGGKSAGGLAAGTMGTVVCCGGNDPAFPVFVSWDGYKGGINAVCNPPAQAYPGSSGWWMACGQIAPLMSKPPGPIIVNLGGNLIQLMPDMTAPGPGFTFAGCVDATIDLNFKAQLSVKVTPAPGVNGSWTGTVTPPIVGPGTVTVQICVQVTYLDLSTLPAGPNAQVATVTLQAVPAP